MFLLGDVADPPPLVRLFEVDDRDPEYRSFAALSVSEDRVAVTCFEEPATDPEGPLGALTRGRPFESFDRLLRQPDLPDRPSPIRQASVYR